jgi:hypothetical protein
MSNRCFSCGHYPIAPNVGTCPACGGHAFAGGEGRPLPPSEPGKALEVRVDEGVGIREGLDLEVRNVAKDRVTRVVTTRQSSSVEGQVDVNLESEDASLSIQVDLRTALEKERDENEIMRVLVPVLSAASGRRFTFLPKEEEDGDYPDFWLSEGRRTKVLGVEITHFDRDSIAGLGKRGHHRRTLALGDMAVLVTEAVRSKVNRDVTIARRTILAVAAPYPIHDVLRHALQRTLQASSAAPHLGCWICPLETRPFVIGHAEPLPDAVQ